MSTVTSKTLSVEQLKKLHRSVAEIGDQHGVVVAAWLIREMCVKLLPHAQETRVDQKTCEHEWTDVARCLRCELTYDMYEDNLEKAPDIRSTCIEPGCTAYLAAIGSKGGKKKGVAKKRGDANHYRGLALSRWEKNSK